MEKPDSQIRTFARISGIAGILVYLVYLFTIIFPGLLELDDPNTTADTAILGFLIVVYLFAWFREYEGGIMLMFISVIAGISYYQQDPSGNLVFILLICIPLVVSGLLFFVYHRRHLRNERE
jgi:hypothetical protein